MLAIQLKSLNLQEETQRKAEEEKKKASLLLADAKSNEFFAETSVMGDILMVLVIDYYFTIILS